ncbi:hypothetical protein, partial [uncultured Bilophila sp.]
LSLSLLKQHQHGVQIVLYRTPSFFFLSPVERAFALPASCVKRRPPVLLGTTGPSFFIPPASV